MSVVSLSASAPATSASAPLTIEAKKFWQDLMEECKLYVNVINDSAADQGVAAEHRVEWRAGSDLEMIKAACPSTTIVATIKFHPWGPAITGRITGKEQCDQSFWPEEFELPIATDLDGQIVAIYDQGRSFSPREMASYLVQSFHRCFPGISLPCWSLAKAHGRAS